MSPKPKLVGITGGIGSGKSLVCKIFNILGIPSYDADSRARVLMHENKKVKLDILKTFGESAYQEDGSLNREWMAGEVFSNESKLKLLNGIVHPAVGKDFAKWVEENLGAPWLIKEAALLFESGSYKNLDFIITVTAPESLRIKRVLARDPHRSEAQIRDIIKKQMSEAEKTARSQAVIINDEKEMVLPQVLKLYKELS